MSTIDAALAVVRKIYELGFNQGGVATCHAEAAYGTVPAGAYQVHAVAWFRIDTSGERVQVAEEWLFVDAAA
jgi:hypothetical protein